MAANEEFRNKIRDLCRDPEYAIVLFLKKFLYPYSSSDLLENAELYGLSRGKVEEVLRAVRSLAESLRPALGVYAEDTILREASEMCSEVFSSELEKAAWERIGRLQNLEAKALRYASYFIKLFKEPWFNRKVFYVSFTGIDRLAESLCATLSIDYSYAQNIAITVLTKTRIAFYTSTYSSGQYYHSYFIPPYALKIVEELSKEVEEEVRKAEETLRRFDAKDLTVLLVKLKTEMREAAPSGSSVGIFGSVYGGNYYEYLRTLNIPGVYHYGCVNYLLRDIAISVALELTRKCFEKLFPVLSNALSERGFDFSVIKEPTAGKIYYTILAVKPEQYDVHIYVMSFPYDWPEEHRGKRVVLVVEAP